MEKYEYDADDLFLRFRFDSIGPNGKIKKIVVFSHISNNLYNLGFGDLTDCGEVDDNIVSNNGDSLKILLTVATIVTAFTNKYGNVGVRFSGSTDSRTRLYQININKYWDIIEPLFCVFGFYGTGWGLFHTGKNYKAFRIYRKSSDH